MGNLKIQQLTESEVIFPNSDFVIELNLLFILTLAFTIVKTFVIELLRVRIWLVRRYSLVMELFTCNIIAIR